MHNGSFINNLSNNRKAVSSENNYVDEQHGNALAKQYRKGKAEQGSHQQTQNPAGAPQAVQDS